MASKLYRSAKVNNQKILQNNMTKWNLSYKHASNIEHKTR